MSKLICLLLGFIVWPVQAGWLLDNESSRISFVTMTDNEHSDVNRFLVMRGSIDDDGQVGVRIELGSVSSGIAQRDEQIRDGLFETKQYPASEVVTQVHLEPILALANGVQMEMHQPITVTLHGKSNVYEADLLVTRLDDNRFQVVTLTPLVLDVADFALIDRLENLRQQARLDNIGLTVPVSAVLIFIRP